MDNTPSKSAWNNCEKMVMAAFQERDYDTAKDLIVKALKIVQSSGQMPPQLIKMAHEVAAAYCLERRYDKAECLYADALATQEKILGTNHPEIVDSLERLAAVIKERQGNTIQAKTIAFRAQSLAKYIQI